ncbi:hypothetical protein [Thermogemmatispora sp.]|uniref:3'-5' exonuclease n=1 Tax=Thermogemmatispora sp. TaxID=1968838 RepID=UPI0035E3FE12
MNQQSLSALLTDLQSLKTQLEQLEQQLPILLGHPPISPLDPATVLQLQQEQRRVGRLLDEFRDSVRFFSEQYQRSFLLPNWQEMRWARATLALHPLFLEVDTTGLHKQADVIRLFLLEADGTVRFDSLVRPQRPPTEEALFYNGLLASSLETAPEAADVWPAFLAALEGRFIVGYSVGWDLEQLDRLCLQGGLPPAPIVAVDLQEHAARYLEGWRYPRLATLCRHLGHPLPEHPQQTAHDRARGQLLILTAMAEGRGVYSSEAVETDLEDLDDTQPF